MIPQNSIKNKVTIKLNRTNIRGNSFSIRYLCFIFYSVLLLEVIINNINALIDKIPPAYATDIY